MLFFFAIVVHTNILVIFVSVTEFKTKLSPAELTELAAVYKLVFERYDPDNPHEQLLHEHVLLLCTRLHQLRGRLQKLYTLKMSSADALAFMQVWDSMNLNYFGEFTRVIIIRIIAEIDKQVKQIAA
jgi:hypothetical protein